MALPILVTGFGKFGEHSTNISGEVAQAISNRNVRGHIIESLVLSVDENGSRVVADRITSGEKFAAIMHIGLAENENRARIEVQAKDILDLDIDIKKTIVWNSARTLKDHWSLG